MKHFTKTFFNQLWLFIVLLTSFWLVYAAWNDVVNEGDTLTSTKWNDLVSKVSDIETNQLLPSPPICNGASQALQWSGSAWSCTTLVRECRVCIQIASNSSADGAKVCSSYSSLGSEQGTGMSWWAEANGGSYGWGKYSVYSRIECR